MKMQMRWTLKDEELAAKYYHSPLSDQEFIEKVGRTRGAWKSRVRYMQTSSDMLLRRRVQRSEDASVRHHRVASPIDRPTDEMMEAAAKRLMSRTVVDELLGNPPPGCSALDEKRFGHEDVKGLAAGDRVAGGEKDSDWFRGISIAAAPGRRNRGDPARYG